MKNPLSTIAKRKAIAVIVSEMATSSLGIDVTLVPSDLHPGQFGIRLENLETDAGVVKWLTFDVTPRGVNVHTKWGCPSMAPYGTTRSNGKWNHYIVWDEAGATPFEDYLRWALGAILGAITLVDATRCNLPNRDAQWAIWRAEFAAVCAAREAATV